MDVNGYSEERVAHLLHLASLPPEASFDDFDDLMAWLENDEDQIFYWGA